MRVAFVSQGLPPMGGGIGSYVQKTTRALAARGHEVHVFTEVQGPSPRTELVEGVRIHRLPSGRVRPAVLGRALAVAGALRREGPFDLVQACEWGGEAAVYSLGRHDPLLTRLATPHYLVERLNEVPRRQRRRQAMSRWMERLQTRRSQLVISPSRSLADEIAGAWSIPRSAIRVVPTGIEAPPTIVGATLPAHLAERPYVLYFGRLEPRKGVDVWLDALPRVLAQHPDTSALLIGEDLGIRGRSFHDYARERCAPFLDRIEFLPHMGQSELFPFVAAASLVVMPSRWENLANTCLEAMALGRPVLATLGGGFEDVITDGVDGYLVPPGDADALAAAAVAALDDRDGLRAVGEAARRRAADFDLGLMVEELLRAYGELLARGRR